MNREEAYLDQYTYEHLPQAIALLDSDEWLQLFHPPVYPSEHEEIQKLRLAVSTVLTALSALRGPRPDPITEIEGLEDSMNKTIYVCRRELVLKRQKELGIDVNDFKWPYAADGREVRFDNPNDPDTGSIEGTGFLIAREWCEEVEAGT